MTSLAPAHDTTSSPLLNMIEGQLRPNGIQDERILSAMERTNRAPFVPEEYASIACIDEEILIAKDRVMLRPLVLARLIQAADIQPDDNVLNIGCATGYSTVILAHLSRSITATESNADLCASTRHHLSMRNLDRVNVVNAPLTQGHSEKGPYHAIVINGAVDDVPTTLLQQLAEGGRLVTIQRDPTAATHAHNLGHLIVYTRVNNHITKRDLGSATANLLKDFTAPPSFTL